MVLRREAEPVRAGNPVFELRTDSPDTIPAALAALDGAWPLPVRPADRATQISILSDDPLGCDLLRTVLCEPANSRPRIEGNGIAATKGRETIVRQA
jgi:hypothetical protein